MSRAFPQPHIFIEIWMGNGLKPRRVCFEFFEGFAILGNGFVKQGEREGFVASLVNSAVQLTERGGADEFFNSV